LIPAIFHHIWVGDKPLPEKARRFIEGAKKLHPGFEFRLWTEETLSLDGNFVRAAYQKKAWAFVSDYWRFRILSEHGGIYLDTDMEVLKPFAPLLNGAGFAGLNRQADAIYCGVIGSAPGHPLMGNVIKAYDHLMDGEMPTSPQMLTRVYKLTKPENFIIYPYSYFYPIEEGEKPVSRHLHNAYAIHHWDESWRKWVPLRRFLRRTGIMPLYHRFTRKINPPVTIKI